MSKDMKKLGSASVVSHPAWAVPAARMTFAMVSWSVDDILELRPTWTRDDALRFLAQHESHLRERLIEHGWSVIETLMGHS